MDAQAAAETQYDESQPDLTQNRKESKIMTKKRRIISMLLALILVVGLAVPALAVTYSGSWGGCNYWMTITRSASSAKATFEYDATVTVKVYAAPTVYLQGSDETIVGTQKSSSATRTASVTINNSVYSPKYQTYMTGEIKQVRAEGYVGTNYIGAWNY